jgi:protein TonB
MSDLGAGGDSVLIGGSGGGGGGGVIGSGSGDYHPSPDEFVPVEVDPVRIRIEPPVYPPMARQAGVEGTVIVRALVNKKGKVTDVIVIEGDPLLKDAAIVSAKSALFRPAMMQNEPVEVWVMMPITFKIR